MAGELPISSLYPRLTRHSASPTNLTSRLLIRVSRSGGALSLALLFGRFIAVSTLPPIVCGHALTGTISVPRPSSTRAHVTDVEVAVRFGPNLHHSVGSGIASAIRLLSPRVRDW